MAYGMLEYAPAPYMYTPHTQVFVIDGIITTALRQGMMNIRCGE